MTVLPFYNIIYTKIYIYAYSLKITYIYIYNTIYEMPLAHIRNRINYLHFYNEC